MTQETQQTHVTVGEEQYEIDHKESVNLSTQDTVMTTKITSPDGMIYRLIPVSELHPGGQNVDTGYMEAHALRGSGVMKHEGRVVKFFMVGGILEHVGYFEEQ